MKTTISSGHGLKVAGSSHFIDEVTEARKVVDRTKVIADSIKNNEVATFHENTAKTVKDNLNSIIAHHNKTTRALDVSIHFNSATFKENGKNVEEVDYAVGIEVLYFSTKGKPHAEALVKKLSEATGLKNRGAKERTNLGFLKNTNKPAILVEVCFVNSKKDVEVYQAKFEKLCIALAEYLTGGTYKPTNPSATSQVNYVARVTADVLNVRSGAGTSYPVTTQIKKGDAYTIIEESSNGWGKLKSGAGWISLAYTEKVK